MPINYKRWEGQEKIKHSFQRRRINDGLLSHRGDLPTKPSPARSLLSLTQRARHSAIWRRPPLEKGKEKRRCQSDFSPPPDAAVPPTTPRQSPPGADAERRKEEGNIINTRIKKRNIAPKRRRRVPFTPRSPGALFWVTFCSPPDNLFLVLFFLPEEKRRNTQRGENKNKKVGLGERDNL